MKNDSPTLPRIILGLLALILLGTFFVINVHSQRQLNFLKQTARHTEGFVSSKHCSNHGSIDYIYRVEGKEFSSSGNSCVETTCAETKIGAPVNVIYSSAKPKLSVCNALSLSENSTSQTYSLLFITGIVFSIIIYRITRNTPIR